MVLNLTGKHEVWRLINLLQREYFICNIDMNILQIFKHINISMKEVS